jgi:hypothetical protein
MYGSHHQQPQKHGRNDELDPYLVVREPSMHGHPVEHDTLSHLRQMTEIAQIEPAAIAVVAALPDALHP